MTADYIKDKITSLLINKYPISKIILFGSRAAGTENENSDVDLIVEFSASISLLTLSGIKCELEDVLGVSVDVIHGPVTKDDMIEIKNEVVLYAA